LLAIVAIPPFSRPRIFVGKKSSDKKPKPVLRPITMQNVESTHDLIATACGAADHAQRIINLKN
jgi:hypothetical protein